MKKSDNDAADKKRIAKRVGDIESLSDIAPIAQEARLKSLDAVINVLTACKAPDRNRAVLSELTMKLKRNAMTRCYGYSDLQTTCLKVMSAIKEVDKLYQKADRKQLQYLMQAIDEACDRLNARKRHLVVDRHGDAAFPARAIENPNRQRFFEDTSNPCDNNEADLGVDEERHDALPAF